MYCDKCGNKLNDADKFCSKCGYKTIPKDSKKNVKIMETVVFVIIGIIIAVVIGNMITSSTTSKKEYAFNCPYCKARVSVKRKDMWKGAKDKELQKIEEDLEELGKEISDLTGEQLNIKKDNDYHCICPNCKKLLTFSKDFTKVKLYR